MPERAVILALGHIAHAAILKAFALAARAFPFSHGARHALPDGRLLYDSYHCSRYNTQTRRLTPEMFHDVMRAIAGELSAPPPVSTQPSAKPTVAVND
jgi:uracil-DNA glycosylase